jgi:hypothetical protein
LLNRLAQTFPRPQDTAAMADDEAKVLADAKKLGFEERVEHKNWKVRSEAFEDIRTACTRAFSSSDQIFSQAGGLHMHLQQRERACALVSLCWGCALSLSLPAPRSCRTPVWQGHWRC